MATTANSWTPGFKGYHGIFTQRRKYDFSDKVIYKGRVMANMLNILSRNLTKMSVTELEPRTFEFEDENDFVQLWNNAGTGTIIELENSDARQFQEGDILFVLKNVHTAAPSQEKIIVQSVGEEDSGALGAGYANLTVRRGAVPIDLATAADWGLVWGGNSVAEGAIGSNARSKEPDYTYNYLQLWDVTLSTSKDVENSEFYAKSFFSLSQESVRKRDTLMKKINWSFYLGERDKETVSNGALKHYTGGVYEFMPTANKVNMANQMSVNLFNEKCSTQFFTHGNKRKSKFLAVGPQFDTALQNMFSQYYRMEVNETLSKFYGIKIRDYETSGGTMHIFREEIFSGTGYSNSAFLLDMDYLAYMYLRNRDIQVAQNTTERRAEWNKKEMKMFGRLGLFRTYAKSHFFLYNPTAPA